jgi:hypothetical protein
MNMFFYPTSKLIYARNGFTITIGDESTSDKNKGAHDYTVCTINDNSIQAEHNATMICKAINATINSNINPDSVPEMLNALKTAYNFLKNGNQESTIVGEQLYNVIQNAKLDD